MITYRVQRVWNRRKRSADFFVFKSILGIWTLLNKEGVPVPYALIDEYSFNTIGNARLLITALKADAVETVNDGIVYEEAE